MLSYFHAVKMFSVESLLQAEFLGNLYLVCQVLPNPGVYTTLSFQHTGKGGERKERQIEKKWEKTGDSFSTDHTGHSELHWRQPQSLLCLVRLLCQEAPRVASNGRKIWKRMGYRGLDL